MRKPAKVDVRAIKKFRRQGLGWEELARRMHRGHHTLRKAAKAAGIPGGDRGRPLKISDRRKIENLEIVLPASPVERLENLLIFDARCLDMETRQELLRIVPQLVQIRHAWKAEYIECGCISCHKKKAGYGAGGLCATCQHRITDRIRIRCRKLMSGRDLPAEIAKFTDGLALRFNTAQRLFNGDQ